MCSSEASATGPVHVAARPSDPRCTCPSVLMPAGDEVEESGEALVEVFGAYAAASFEPVLTLPYQSRFAKCLEVVGKGGFGAVESEPAAGMVVVLGFKHQFAHDRQP